MKMQTFLIHALISLVSLADAFKILFFWSVDSDKQTQDLVKANVDFVKAHGGSDCCDVMLSHYKGQPADWDLEWYSEHVVQNYIGSGYKFNALKALYNQKQLCDKWETLYEWVWALDSDIDIRGVDLDHLFQLARESTSLIVSPTFNGNSQQWTSFGLLEDSESTDHRIHVIGKPDEKCKFRHSTYVEMTAPLLHGLTLESLFAEGKCEHCLSDKADWGIDQIWCSHVKKSVSGTELPCAYLDETPVLHLDWKSAQVNNDFSSTAADVQRNHPDEWAAIKALDCVPRR